MSLAQFSRGLAEGLPAGIDLARELDRQREVKAGRKAGELLAAYTSADPFALTDDASQQGIAEPGQVPQVSPNRGFDGSDLDQIHSEYMKAISGISDPRLYAQAAQNFGTARMEKINNYLDQGIAAYDQGDTATATKMLRAASAFMSPGTTPEINIDPQSGAFVVANYDAKGNPSSGYALSRDQLMDLRWRNTDWQGWAQQEKRDAEFDRQMSLRYAQFAASKARASAAAARAQSADDRKAEIDALKLIEGRLDIDIKSMEKEKMASTIDAEIAAKNAESEATIATQQGITENAAAVAAANAAKAAAEEAKAIGEIGTEADKSLQEYKSELEKMITSVPQPPEGEEGSELDLSQLATDENGKQVYVDNWWLRKDDKGQAYVSDVLTNFSDEMGRDLTNPELNPDSNATKNAYFTVGAYGPDASTQVVDYDPESKTATIQADTGEQATVSGETAAHIRNWQRETYALSLARGTRSPNAWAPEPEPAPQAAAPQATAPATAIPVGQTPVIQPMGLGTTNALPGQTGDPGGPRQFAPGSPIKTWGSNVGVPPGLQGMVPPVPQAIDDTRVIVPNRARAR